MNIVFSFISYTAFEILILATSYKELNLDCKGANRFGLMQGLHKKKEKKKKYVTLYDDHEYNIASLPIQSSCWRAFIPVQ